MMAMIDGSGLPQYLMYQLLLGNLSRRQRNKYLQSIFIADLPSAFALINNPQKQITELQLTKGNTIVPLSPSALPTVPLTLSPAPGLLISLCTPAAATAEDVHACSEFSVCELKLVSAAHSA